MSVHPMPEPDRNDRLVPFMPDVDPEGARFLTTKRDFVKPVPEGTYIGMVFRITGYRQDCDGSALAEVEQVDCHGELTGWTSSALGLYADTDVVLDGPGDLHELVNSDATETQGGPDAA